jgi:hypothetical protein
VTSRKLFFQLDDYLCSFTGENILLVVIMWVLLRRPTPNASGLCLICMDDGSLDPIPIRPYIQTSMCVWCYVVECMIVDVSSLTSHIVLFLVIKRTLGPIWFLGI